MPKNPSDEPAAQAHALQPFARGSGPPGRDVAAPGYLSGHTCSILVSSDRSSAFGVRDLDPAAAPDSLGRTGSATTAALPLSQAD
jgi:hypothetical protein